MEKFAPNRSSVFYETGVLYPNGRWNKLVLEIYLFQFQNHIIKLLNSQLLNMDSWSQGNILHSTICEKRGGKKKKKTKTVIIGFIDKLKY